MCKNNPNECKAKIKCKSCSSAVKQSFIQLVDKGYIKRIDSNEEHDILTLDEVDSEFEQQYYVIDIKGE